MGVLADCEGINKTTDIDCAGKKIYIWLLEQSITFLVCYNGVSSIKLI